MKDPCWEMTELGAGEDVCLFAWVKWHRAFRVS